MQIRKAEHEDLNKIMEIFRNAIKVMNDNNINQWDDIYPTNTILEQDVLNGQMYVGIKDGELVSALVINNECEEEYKKGNWRYDNNTFAVVHRLCVNPIYQNKKIGKDTMIKIEEILKTENSIYKIRHVFSKSICLKNVSNTWISKGWRSKVENRIISFT